MWGQEKDNLEFNVRIKIRIILNPIICFIFKIQAIPYPNILDRSLPEAMLCKRS